MSHCLIQIYRSSSEATTPPPTKAFSGSSVEQWILLKQVDRLIKPYILSACILGLLHLLQLRHSLLLRKLYAIFRIQHFICVSTFQISIHSQTCLQLIFKFAVSFHELLIFIQGNRHFAFSPLQSRGELFDDLVGLFELIVILRGLADVHALLLLLVEAQSIHAHL